MEANQIHLVATAMCGDAQQIVHAVKPRFTGEIVGEVRDLHRVDRIHNDVTVVHAVTTVHLDMGARPDADRAPDSPAPNPLAKAFGEHHELRTVRWILRSR